MPRGAKVKTSWRKKQVIKKRPIKKVKAQALAEREKEARRRKGYTVVRRSKKSEALQPHRGVKLVMNKREPFEHPLEEILFPENEEDRAESTPHERLVEFQKECSHSFSKVLTQRVEDGKTRKLVQCGDCWASKWA